VRVRVLAPCGITPFPLHRHGDITVMVSHFPVVSHSFSDALMLYFTQHSVFRIFRGLAFRRTSCSRNVNGDSTVVFKKRRGGLAFGGLSIIGAYVGAFTIFSLLRKRIKLCAQTGYVLWNPVRLDGYAQTLRKPFQQAQAQASALISYQEVQKHNTRDSCWVIIDGRVYDVTCIIDSHPGGTAVLLKNAGKDAT
jgi:hypothetical protein